MSPDAPSRNTFNLKMLLVLAFGHLATDLCQSALPVILPFLKVKLGLSYAMSGMIMLASNVTSSVIQPLFGYVSDQKEKAFLMPLGCLCAGVGLSLLAIPNHFAVVLLLVMVSGLGIAAYHPEGFKTARHFTGEKLATGLAVFTVGGNLGLALGPIAATFVITNFGLESLPLLLVFSGSFLLLLFIARRSIIHSRPRSVQTEKKTTKISQQAFISLGTLVAAVIMRSWTHFGLMAYIPFYYIDYEKGDPLYAGMLVSVFLAGGVVGTLAGSPLADRWGYKRFLILSMAVGSICLPAVLYVHGVMLVAALGFIGMVLISSFTVTMVMAQEMLPKNLGLASGIMAGFAIGTGGIGVTILGVVADHFGVPAALKTIMVLPVIGLVLSCLVSFPIKQMEKVEAK